MPDLQIIVDIRRLLGEQSDENIRNSSRRYFKENIKLYGVSSASVKNITRQFLPAVRKKNKAEVFHICDELFRSDYCEEAFIASDFAYSFNKLYKPEDFTVFEKWVTSYINNWAKCDTLCNHTIGSFVEMYPQYIENLKVWTASGNRWVKRAAAVTLILPARKGKFLNDIFDIADKLLTDKDDLVQKGYGWMLKEASRQHQGEVFSYIMKNKHIMPRTALRYAIEKMPPDLRARAIARP